MQCGPSSGAVASVVVVVASGCDARSDLSETRTSEIVSGSPIRLDPAGFAFLDDGVVGSGMFLAPEWVITAGHFINDWDSMGRTTWNAPPVVGTVAFGTGIDGSQGTPFVHPGWWGALGIGAPPPIGPRDTTYDVGLVRLNNPRDGSTFTNKLYNQLSNGAVGSTIRCYGYGATSLDGSGGGIGMLQTADFPVIDYEIEPGVPLPFPFNPSSTPMIAVADGPSGQRLFPRRFRWRVHDGRPVTLRTPISGITSTYRDFDGGSHQDISSILGT